MSDGPRTEILIRHQVGDYELSEGNWHTFIAAANCHVPCAEMGIRNVRTEEFTLFQHGNPRHAEMVEQVAERLDKGWTPKQIVEAWDDDAWLR